MMNLWSLQMNVMEWVVIYDRSLELADRSHIRGRGA